MVKREVRLFKDFLSLKQNVIFPETGYIKKVKKTPRQRGPVLFNHINFIEVLEEKEERLIERFTVNILHFPAFILIFLISWLLPPL